MEAILISKSNQPPTNVASTKNDQVEEHMENLEDVEYIKGEIK
jgi:hypothetical protein